MWPCSGHVDGLVYLKADFDQCSRNALGLG